MYNKNTIDTIIKAEAKIGLMIKRMEEQNIVNFGLLYQLKELIKEVESIVLKEQSASIDLINKWNNITGRMFRALEGTVLQDLLDKIESDVIKNKSNS